jgi:cytochrome c oxidase cbb3-type subunit 3
MDQTSEYNRKVAEYEASKKLLQNELSAGDGMNMDEMIAAGATLYAEKGCIACHGMKGEGNQIGPNLTDNFWLNGCSTDDLIKIITEGKPEKGMTPYKTMMSENQIKNVSTYILHALVGSNPDNGKAAQGEECTVN